MENMTKFALMALCAATVVSCAKESDFSASKQGKVVSLSVAASVPDFEDADNPGTKITFDGAKYWWEGSENMKVLIGSSSTSNLKTGKQVTLPTTGYGTFGGSIDLGTFSVTDIQAVVVPATASSYYRYYKNSHRIIIPLTVKQVQASDGVMNVSYAPLYARLSLDQEPEGDYEIDKLSLRPATYTMRFNVYSGEGGVAAGEKVESVSVKYSNTNASYFEGQFATDGSTSFVSQSGSVNTWSVSLGTPAPVGQTASEGVKMFLSVSPRYLTMNVVTVTTDKAVYTKTLSKKLGTYASLPGQMFQFGLNLSTFERAE